MYQATQPPEVRPIQPQAFGWAICLTTHRNEQWAARTLSSFLDACLITHQRRSLHIQVAAEAPLVHASEGWVSETWWWAWRCVTRSRCKYRACKRFSLPEWTAIMSRASSLLDSLSALEVRLCACVCVVVGYALPVLAHAVVFGWDAD